MDVTWFSQSAFLFEGEGKTIYIDPYKVVSKRKADLILVTHSHYDHMDPQTIAALSGSKTTVVGPRDVQNNLKQEIVSVEPSTEHVFDDVVVCVVEAYNIHRTAHPRGFGVGYVMELEGKRIYHAGDTDVTPKMLSLKDIDLALLPVGGCFTMDWREASQAVKSFKPEFAAPMHYGSVVGSKKDAKAFKRQVESETATRAIVFESGEKISL
ncbi:MAG: MBL fold metallo-hydrolase [Candidatus Altiarchaeales archaeon]|nr:MBL fold metallo-hydrolase [Candidatus Altiarchaeales archaeon]